MTTDTSAPTGRPLPRFGRYETVGVLGRGAFAAVYEAHDPALESTVAIKVLADHHSTDPDIRERFIREARLVRRIGTDRLVAVHDIGEENGQPYIVMELAQGGTLAERINQLDDQPVSAAALSQIIGELSAALTAIHRAGVVHRDIKPSNVLIQPSPAATSVASSGLLQPGDRLVLGDFGLAREVDASALTMASGTDGYMAPEQRTPSASIDERADLYAATAIVNGLLTGPARTPALEAAIARGMATDPAQRPADATAWGRELLVALGPNAAPPPPAPPSAPPPPAPPSAPPSVVAAAESSRRPNAALLGALAAIFIGAIAWFALAGGSADGPTIVGPKRIEVGETTIYRADAQAGATYYWIDWQGVRHDGPALRVDPSSTGALPITLTEVIGDNESSTDLTIAVEQR